MLWPNGTRTRPAISSPFGPRKGGAFSVHYGTDFIGFTTIHAVAAGKVTFAGLLNPAAGYTIIVDHGGGITSVYMHNDYHHVRKGDHVAEGEPIAVMGDSGNATGDCCHLEIRIKGVSVDPVPYITARLTPGSGYAAGGEVTPPVPTIHTESEEDEMPATYINIQGKTGSHRGGCYAIMRSNTGVLFARFVSPTMLPSAPTVPVAEYEAWANTMSIK